MPGVSIGETVSCSNPLLQFYHQISGKMANVVTLSFTIHNVRTGSTIVASTNPTLTDCSAGGHRLSTGRYVAGFAATGSDWLDGTHEITWTYTSTAGGDSKTWRQRFEVLKATTRAVGQGYRAYVNSIDLVKNSALMGCSIPDLQMAAFDASQQIETLTGRFFEPTYIDTRINGLGGGALPLYNPIIGIGEINLYAGNTVSTEVDLDSIVVFNRHLTDGLYEPDDRDNPRIEFVQSSTLNNTYVQSEFPLGRQNIQIIGVFGYTEFDGSCVGSHPRMLARVAAMLTYRQVMDPFNLDIAISQPGKIKSAKTRDQSITFADAKSGGVGAITGDRAIDDLLMPFLKPPQFHAVPQNNRIQL